MIGCTSVLLQSVWNAKRPELVKLAFNVLGMMAPAIALSYWAYAQSGPWLHDASNVESGSRGLGRDLAENWAWAGVNACLSRDR